MVRKSKLAGAPDSFADVVREIRAFLLPLVQTVSLKQIFASRWASGGPWSSHHSLLLGHLLPRAQNLLTDYTVCLYSISTRIDPIGTESISTSLSFVFSLHVHSAQMTSIMFRRRRLVPRFRVETQRASSPRKPQGWSRQSWQRFGLFD